MFVINNDFSIEEVIKSTKLTGKRYKAIILTFGDIR